MNTKALVRVSVNLTQAQMNDLWLIGSLQLKDMNGLPAEVKDSRKCLIRKVMDQIEPHVSQAVKDAAKVFMPEKIGEAYAKEHVAIGHMQHTIDFDQDVESLLYPKPDAEIGPQDKTE